MTFGVLVVMILQLGLAACTGEEGGGIPGGTLQAPGTGEASVEPLWPVRPGASWSRKAQREITGAWDKGFRYRDTVDPYYYPMADLTYIASPPRRIGGREVTALYGINVQGDHHLGRFPHQPDPLAWWSSGPDGALFHGQLRGALSQPILFAPSKAKVGMRWTTESAGGTLLYAFEVVSRTVQDTMWGRRPVWHVEYEDFRNYQLNYYHEWVADTTTFTVDFVEGRGPLSFEPSLRGGREYTSVVVPLEDPAPMAAPPSTRTPVRTLLGGEPLPKGSVSGMVPGGLSMTAFPDDPDVLQGIIYGRAVVINQPFGGSNIGVTTASDGPAHYCLSLTRGELNHDVNYAECLEAQGLVFDVDGGSHINSVSHLRSTLSHIMMGKFDCNDGDCFDWEISGIYRGLDGVLRVLAGSYGLLSTGDLDWNKGRDNILPPIHHHGYALDESGTFLRFARDTEAGLIVGTEDYSRLALAVVPPDGGSITRRFHATYLGGAYSVLTTVEGQRLFRTSPDGRIEELVLTADGVDVLLLAEVDLDEGELLGGAVAWGDDLLVVINRNFQGATTADAGAQVPVPRFGDLYMGLVTPRAPEPTRDSPLFGLEFRQEGMDVVVCWPPGQPAPELEGWTIAGEPAAVQPFDDHCVLVVRNGDTGASFDPLNHEVVGPIPGAGRTAMASPSVEQEFVFPACGALTEGGCVGLEGTYAPGLSRWSPNVARELIFTNTDNFGSSYQTGPLIVDRRGGGIWFWPEPFTSHPTVFYRFDGAGRHEYPDSGTTVTAGTMEDGGILRVDASGKTTGLRADGTDVEFPEVDPVDEWSPSWYFQDGSLCGVVHGWDPWTAETWYRGVRCQRTGDASPAEALFPESLPTPAFEGGTPISLSSTLHYLITSNLFTWADLTTGKVQVLRPASIGVDVPQGSNVAHAAAQGPDGRAFVLLRIDKQFSVDWELVELTEEGPEIVDIPRLGTLPDDSEPALFVDADYYVFQGGLRAPRGP